MTTAPEAKAGNVEKKKKGGTHTGSAIMAEMQAGDDESSGKIQVAGDLSPLAPVAPNAEKKKLPELNDELIKRELETATKTEGMLISYGSQVFAYTKGKKNGTDKTDPFIRLLFNEGTKESAMVVADFLALSKVELEKDVRLSHDNPIDLHLRKDHEPLRRLAEKKSESSEEASERSGKVLIDLCPTVHSIVKKIPALEAKLDCDDVRALLKMFDGCIAPKILDLLFIPLQLHQGHRPQNRWESVKEFFHSAMKSNRGEGQQRSLSGKAFQRGSLEPRETDTDELIWKNPVYSARLFDKEVRTYVGPSLKCAKADHWGKEGAHWWLFEIFSKPGLKSLVPQSYQDRINSGGGLVQVLWPFHERRKVQVSYGILNIHEDIGCFSALVFNRNKKVFDNNGCQAIIKHVLGDVSSIIYLNLLTNILVVCLWLAYSKHMREEAGGSTKHHPWIFARCLLAVYIYRGLQIIMQVLGASWLGMLRGLVGSAFFYWQIVQTLVSAACLFTLWEKGTSLSNLSRTMVSAIIGAQWWNALFAFRIIRTLGMAHALFTLGVHGGNDSTMLTFRLGILGDFDIAELDGTESGMKASNKSNFSIPSLDMEMYDFGSSSADRTFARLFVLIVSVMSTVLLMNVLIGVLSTNFAEEYEQRTQIYWQTAGKIALQSVQQWEGFRHCCLKRCQLKPVLYKVTATYTNPDEEKEHQHLWFSTPASVNEKEERKLQDRIYEMEDEMNVMRKHMGELMEAIKNLPSSSAK